MGEDLNRKGGPCSWILAQRAKSSQGSSEFIELIEVSIFVINLLGVHLFPMRYGQR